MIQDHAKKILNELNKLESTTVKVGLFGQPGAGKSSLINALTGIEVSKPGVENDMTPGKPIEWKGLLFVDLPGYGTEKYPKETYFNEFDIFSFDLFLCVFDGKWRQADSEFFQKVLKMKPCLFVRNKIDTLWEKGYTTEQLKERIHEDIKKLANADIKVYFTSCKTNEGLEDLSDSIQQILEPTKREKWLKEAKAYSLNFLQGKRKVCEKYIAISSGLSAVNALNPIRGADIAVDIGVLSKCFNDIKESFGLDNNTLKQLHTYAPRLNNVANRIIEYVTKAGLQLLLKKFAGKQALKGFAKYVPYIGQAIAASTGYIVTSNAGKMYLDYCYKAAEAILNHELHINEGTFK